MAQQTKAAASTAAPTGPVYTAVYTAVHPTAQSTLADVQVPAQTLASGTAAVDGQWAWVAYAPDGTDVSAHLDDDTLARPTLDLAAAVAAGCRAAGTWAFKGVPTVNAVAGPAITLRLVVGEDGKVQLWRGILPSLAVSDYTGGGTTRTVDGLTVTIVNQAKLAVGSGSDGTDGVDLLCTGDHTLWFSGVDPRGAVGLMATIQSVFDLHGLTYDRQQHALDLIIKWAATPAPTTSAVYGAVMATGAWSTTTTHVMGSVTENNAGSARNGATQIRGVTDGNYVHGTSPGSYPRWQGIRRTGQSCAMWSSTTSVSGPATVPATYAEGYQSIDGSIDVASAWADATDIFGAVLSNAGTGTAAATLATIELWASL